MVGLYKWITDEVCKCMYQDIGEYCSLAAKEPCVHPKDINIKQSKITAKYIQHCNVSTAGIVSMSHNVESILHKLC